LKFTISLASALKTKWSPKPSLITWRLHNRIYTSITCIRARSRASVYEYVLRSYADRDMNSMAHYFQNIFWLQIILQLYILQWLFEVVIVLLSIEWESCVKIHHIYILRSINFSVATTMRFIMELSSAIIVR